MKNGARLFPIRLLLQFGETGLKIIVFLFGFAFKSTGFIMRRFFVLIVGAIIGAFLGKKYIEKKVVQGKKQ